MRAACLLLSEAAAGVAVNGPLLTVFIRRLPPERLRTSSFFFPLLRAIGSEQFRC